jgi:hypothetical protein
VDSCRTLVSVEGECLHVNTFVYSNISRRNGSEQNARTFWRNYPHAIFLSREDYIIERAMGESRIKPVASLV